MSNESTKWLYDNLTAEGYNVGKDLAEFDSLMVHNEESRKWAFETARNLGYNVGTDFDEFSKLVAPATSQYTFAASKPELNDNARKLYDALSQEYDLGTFEQFERDIADAGKRRKLYDATIDEYDFGDFSAFESQLGFAPQTQEVPLLPKINKNAYTFSSQELELGLSILTILIISVVWYKLIKRAK